MGPDAREELLEDAAQDLSVDFFSLPDFEKPRTVDEFQHWAFKNARNIISRARKSAKNEIPDEFINVYGETEHRSDEYSQVGIYYARVKPNQLIHMDFLDAIKQIESLGERDRKLVYSVIDAGDVVGYSKDNNVTLFDAMDDLAKCRDIMKRIAEDLADEKKFGDVA